VQNETIFWYGWRHCFAVSLADIAGGQEVRIGETNDLIAALLLFFGGAGESTLPLFQR
jgi:hypothetical protein